MSTFWKALIVIMIGVAALAGTAIAAGRADTEITEVVVEPNADFSHATYSGKLESKDKDCLKGRKVKIIHLSDPPFTIGTTITDEDGNFSLDGPLPPGPSERIKIKVKKTKHCDKAKHTYTVGDLIAD